MSLNFRRAIIYIQTIDSSIDSITTQIEVLVNNQKDSEYEKLLGESSSEDEPSQFYTVKSVLVRWENFED